MRTYALKKPVTATKQITHFSVSINITLGDGDQYAFATVHKLYDDATIHSTQTINFSKADLDEWGDDDNVLITLIEKKLTGK